MHQTTQTFLDAIREKTGHAPRACNGGWQAHCPAHDDRRPSLSINEGDAGVLVCCQAGCASKAVVEAVGLTMKDLFYAKPENHDRPVEVAAYPYHDTDGTLLSEVVRFVPKDFRVRRTDANGKVVWDAKGVKRVLYRLPEVLAAIERGETIYIVEGEKDADNLCKIGLTATCNPHGAGKWRPEYSESLGGADVVILPDSDPPGKKHAETVAKALDGVAKSVRIVELPGLPAKGDVSDWLAQGHTRAELEALAKPKPLLEASDILNAPDPPAPIFERGPVRGTLALLVAESGRSKSFEALTWAASLATGKTIQRVFAPNEAGPVMYCSFEDNPAVIRWRLARITETNPDLCESTKDALRAGRLTFYCDAPMPVYEAMERGVVGPTALFGELADLIAKISPVAVVVDPLSGAAILRDENSNAELATVAAGLANLAKRQNTVVMLIHHAGKTAGAGQHATRGASSLACRARWIANITPIDEDPDLVTLAIVKDSYHRLPDPVTLKRTLGGALVEHTPIVRDPLVLTPFIQDYLIAHPEAEVSSQSIQQRKGDGKLLWTELAREYPWVTANLVRDAVECGTRDGIFRVEDIRRPNGRTVRTLKPGKVSAVASDDNEADDETPF